MAMKTHVGALILSLAFTLASGPAAAAQAWFFPDFALPSAGDQPATWIAATYGRGLNELSGENNAIGASIGRTSDRVSFSGGLGYITDDDGEYTAGGSIGVDLNSGPGPRFSLQAGVGWIDFDFFDDKVTFLRFPVGIALKTRMEGESATVMPWVMPRLNIVRVSGGGESETESDFGASGGVSFSMTQGLGFHVALDGLFSESEAVWLLGIGLHYVLGR
jgi:hypothetical protein